MTPCEIDPNEKVLRRQCKTAQQLANHFWNRWLQEYLPTITRRTKSNGSRMSSLWKSRMSYLLWMTVFQEILGPRNNNRGVYGR